jgi:hypothetical protein
MRKVLISLMIAGGALFIGPAAFADEVVIEHPGAVPPPPSEHHEVTVEHHSGSDCQTTTVHKENDQGDSKTVHKTDCD